MNPVIKRELEKVRAPLPEYDDNTTLITILRKSAEPNAQVPQLVENHCYIVELESYILNEPPNFTLSANWNKGIIPKSKYLQIEVSKVMGKMVQVNGCGYDIVTNQSLMDGYIGLWLPALGVKVVTEI